MRSLVFYFTLMLFVALSYISGFASGVVGIPSLTQPVMDQAGFLSSRVQNDLDQALRRLNRLGVAQLAILTVPDLKGESIEGYSIRVVEKWKLGTEEKDNGVLFLISLKDRKMRIEVGQGLEGVLTDAKASRIIRENVSILFKNKQFEKGIVVGAFSIAETLIGFENAKNLFGANIKKTHLRKSKRKNYLGTIVFFLFFILPLFGSRGGFLSYLFLGSMLGGRGRYGGGFGGGGFSGGGGGFSGGGASGSW